MVLVKNINLAELMGIYLGDGNLGNYPKYPNLKNNSVRCQYLRIYCNLNEKQYAYERPSENVLYLEISLKNIDKLLNIPAGSKIKNKVRIPQWIFRNKEFLKVCLRGLFDTDGCCYLTGGKYRIINFCNKNTGLLKDIFQSLKMLDFHPYIKGEKDIEIGRQSEVNKFFDIIKPRNYKHYRYAEVANVVTAGL